MRAVVRQTSNGDYQARFSGRFALVIPFTYKVTMQPSYDNNGNVWLSANKKLGPILGGYQMNSIVQGSSFSGSFQAAGDTGSVQMQRVR